MILSAPLLITQAPAMYKQFPATRLFFNIQAYPTGPARTQK